MGIPVLWDLIKDQDKSIQIAQLAEDHYQQYHRPLRIAVDEADWRFNNLTPQQVYTIRETSKQPYQGIEKLMFYRICRLLTLNIQLLFVFDGPKRPWKRGKRGGNKVDFEQRRPLKEMLQCFRIPYHEAPGEAEAECARLQQLGIVDAVFSQDSDALMFGCDCLLRDDRIAKGSGNNDRSKENTKKSGTSMRVVRGRDIVDAHGLDRDGLVLLAMLAGGDYDTSGLKGCGIATTFRAVKAGLGTTLSLCRTKHDCMRWQEELRAFLQTTSRGSQISVPSNFPDINTLNKYLRPTISSDEQLRNLRGLRNGWNQPISELKLLELTSSRFNIWGRLYMNWVGPVLLMKSFVSCNSTTTSGNPHQVVLKKQRAQKAEDGTPIRKLERKITFSPFGLTSLSRADFEGGERAGYWTGIATDPFDPDHRVEWNFPTYWLGKMLPHDVLNSPSSTPKASQKRKQPVEDGQEALLSKRSRHPNIRTIPTASSPLRPNHLTTPSASRQLATSVNGESSEANVIVISDTEDSDSLEEFDISMFQTPSVSQNGSRAPGNTPSYLTSVGQQPTRILPNIGNSNANSAYGEDDPEIREAIWLSLQEGQNPVQSPAAMVTRFRSESRNHNVLNSSDISTPASFASIPPEVTNSDPPRPQRAARIPHRTTSHASPNRPPSESLSRSISNPPKSTEIEQVRAARLRYYAESRGDLPRHLSIPPSDEETDQGSNLTSVQQSTKSMDIECIDLT